jgi:peptidoglycan/LPS O-acetylase OafA/YrhL
MRTFADSHLPIHFDRSRLEQTLYDLLGTGQFGVQLFFAISGFIIALPFIACHTQRAPTVNIGRFYLRRLTRLEPPYIINLLFYSVIRLAVDNESWSFVLPRLFASLIYMHNQIFGDYSVINSVAWSLEIEFQFYFLAPLILCIFTIQSHSVRTILLLTTALSIIMLRPTGWHIAMSLVGQWEYFAVGIVAADWYFTVWKGVLPRLRAYDLLFALSGSVLVATLFVSRTPGIDILKMLLLLGAMLGALGGRVAEALFGNAWAAIIGGMCYTIYLYHSAVMSLMMRLTRHIYIANSYLLTYVLHLALCVFAILLACTVLFMFFERPFMQRDWPQAAASVVAAASRSARRLTYQSARRLFRLAVLERPRSTRDSDERTDCLASETP